MTQVLCPLPTQLHLAALADWHICAVAGGALLGSRLVKKYSFAAYYTGEFVAVSTAHVAVPSLQRESGSLFMIE